MHPASKKSKPCITWTESISQTYFVWSSLHCQKKLSHLKNQVVSHKNLGFWLSLQNQIIWLYGVLNSTWRQSTVTHICYLVRQFGTTVSVQVVWRITIEAFASNTCSVSVIIIISLSMSTSSTLWHLRMNSAQAYDGDTNISFTPSFSLLDSSSVSLSIRTFCSKGSVLDLCCSILQLLITSGYCTLEMWIVQLRKWIFNFI